MPLINEAELQSMTAAMSQPVMERAPDTGARQPTLSEKVEMLRSNQQGLEHQTSEATAIFNHLDERLRRIEHELGLPALDFCSPPHPDSPRWG